MIRNKYSVGLIDESWIRSRNSFAISGRNETYDAMDIVKMTFQSIAKFVRDLGCDCDRLYLVQDKWSPAVKGYYRKQVIGELPEGLVEYKGDRKYMTEELLESIKCDPNSTEEDIKKAEKELYFNTQTRRAKWILNNEFSKLGISSISMEGFEYDDLVSLFSLEFAKDLEKPGLIITKDSDLIYSTSPNCHLFQPPLGGKPAKFITYDEAYERMPERFRGKLGLYQYHSLVDSCGGGHNNNARTVKDGVDIDDAIEQAMNNDFSSFIYKDLFIRQYKSFNIWEFPDIDRAKKLVSNLDNVPGKLGSLEDFHNFCNKYNMTGVSDKYYTDFINHFDNNNFKNQ